MFAHQLERVDRTHVGDNAYNNNLTVDIMQIMRAARTDVHNAETRAACNCELYMLITAQVLMLRRMHIFAEPIMCVAQRYVI